VVMEATPHPQTPPSPDFAVPLVLNQSSLRNGLFFKTFKNIEFTPRLSLSTTITAHLLGPDQLCSVKARSTPQVPQVQSIVAMSAVSGRQRSPSRASVASEVDVSTSGAGFTSIDERYHFGSKPLATRHRSRTVHAWHGEQAYFQILVPLPDIYNKPLTLKVEVSDFFEPDTSSAAFSALECVKLFVVKAVRADMQVVYDRLEPLPLAPCRSKDGSYIDALSAEVPLPADGLVPGNSDPWLLPVPWVPGRTGRRGKLRDNTASDRFVLLWGCVHAPTQALTPPTYSFQGAMSEAASAAPAAALLPTYSSTLRLTFESSEPLVAPPAGALQSNMGAHALAHATGMSVPFPGASPEPPPRGSTVGSMSSPALVTSALSLAGSPVHTSTAASGPATVASVPQSAGPSSAALTATQPSSSAALCLPLTPLPPPSPPCSKPRQAKWLALSHCNLQQGLLMPSQYSHKWLTPQS
jgi:hypothetical protein